MGVKNNKKEESISTRVLHQVFLNLGYETAVSRTLRECAIDDIDINSILIRAGVKPRKSLPEMGKYDRMMTIKQFIKTVEEEYGTKESE